MPSWWTAPALRRDAAMSLSPVIESLRSGTTSLTVTAKSTPTDFS
jgi:hypothetical protein